MMTLAQASTYFDRTPALDPDNDVVRFLCQIGPYDDSRRDAGGAYRRILSVASGTPMPAKRAIRVFGQVWLIGARQTDGLDDPHRDKYVLQPSEHKVSISRLPRFLSGTVAAACWASVEWAKDARELEASSNLPQTYYAYLPRGTDVRVQDVLWFSGSAFLVAATHEQPSGYTLANCSRLEQVLPEVATLTGRTYQPAQGSFLDSPAVNVSSLRVRWRSLYLYGSQDDARYQEGDYSVVLPPATVLDTATRLDLAGRLWQVISSEMLAGALVAHVRPA